jgi:hypothetical protein
LQKIKVQIAEHVSTMQDQFTQESIKTLEQKDINARRQKFINFYRQDVLDLELIRQQFTQLQTPLNQSNSVHRLAIDRIKRSLQTIDRQKEMLTILIMKEEAILTASVEYEKKEKVEKPKKQEEPQEERRAKNMMFRAENEIIAINETLKAKQIDKRLLFEQEGKCKKTRDELVGLLNEVKPEQLKKEITKTIEKLTDVIDNSESKISRQERERREKEEQEKQEKIEEKRQEQILEMAGFILKNNYSTTVLQYSGKDRSAQNFLNAINKPGTLFAKSPIDEISPKLFIEAKTAQNERETAFNEWKEASKKERESREEKTRVVSEEEKNKLKEERETLDAKWHETRGKERALKILYNLISKKRFFGDLE